MYKLNHSVWSLKISTAEKVVLLYLLDRANGQGVCWPSLNTIAEATSLSRRSVINALQRLKGKGLVSWTSKDGGANLYQINIAALEGSATIAPGSAKDAPGEVQPLHQGVQPLHGGSANVARGVVQPLHPNHPIEPPIEPSNNNPPLYPPPNAAPQDPPSSPPAVAAGGEVSQTQNPKTPKATPNRESEVLAREKIFLAGDTGMPPDMTPDQVRAALEERIPRRMPPPPQVPGEMVRELREAGLWERFSALRRYARDSRAWHEWLAGPVAAQWRRLGGNFTLTIREALDRLASRPDLARPLIWLERQLERATPPPPPKTREEELVDQVVRAPTLEEAVDAFLEWARSMREEVSNERPVA